MTVNAPDGSPITWLDEPELHDNLGLTLGSYGGWLIQVCPMIFNDRLVLTPETFTDIYTYGWCYPKGGAAHLAALAWNPDIDGEPAGFIKAIGGPRQPGEVWS